MKVIGIIFLLAVFIGAIYECKKEYGIWIAIASAVTGAVIGAIIRCVIGE